MTLEQLSALLGWSALINFAILWIWWLAFLFAGNTIFRIHSRWFKVTREQFDAFNYGGLGLFKLVNFTFFIAPWLAIRIVI